LQRSACVNIIVTTPIFALYSATWTPYLWKTSRKWMLRTKEYSQSSVFQKVFLECYRGVLGREIWNSVALWCSGVAFPFWVGLEWVGGLEFQLN